MDITFDRAIELLEITDIGDISAGDLPALLKRARRRWHPDSVEHLRDPAVTAEYTAAFQQLERACEMVQAFLAGEYQAGAAFTGRQEREHEEPAEVIRREAPSMQARLRKLWETIRAQAYKKETKKVQLSDGFNLKDMLNEDLKDDIAFLSMVAFAFGFIPLAVLTATVGAANPVLGGLLAGSTVLFSVCCILGAAPLSRFWLPEPAAAAVIWAVNFGLRIHRMVAPAPNKPDQPGWLVFLVCLPVILARLVKWLIVWPLYAIAKAGVGDKVVGVVYQEVDYYAGAAQWYVEELLGKDANEMTEEELFDLSQLYSELTGAEDVMPDPFAAYAEGQSLGLGQRTRGQLTLAWLLQPRRIGQALAIILLCVAPVFTALSVMSREPAQSYRDEPRRTASVPPNRTVPPEFLERSVRPRQTLPDKTVPNANSTSNSSAPVPPPASPEKEFTIEVTDEVAAGGNAWENRTLLLRRGARVIGRYPTMGFVLDAHWMADGSHVAINNRRGNSGDYLWIIRVSDGTTLKKPDDALSREIEERALSLTDKAAQRQSSYFQRHKTWTAAQSWNSDGTLRASLRASYMIPNKDSWEQEIPVLLTISGNAVSIKTLGDTPTANTPPPQVAPEFSNWLHDNWNLRVDHAVGTLIIEMDWMARIGAFRSETPLQDLDLESITAGAPATGGAYRDAVPVTIPLRKGRSTATETWPSDPAVDAPWRHNVPAQTTLLEQRLEVYAKDKASARKLALALRQLPVPPPVAAAADTTLPSAPSPAQPWQLRCEKDILWLRPPDGKEFTLAGSVAFSDGLVSPDGAAVAVLEIKSNVPPRLRFFFRLHDQDYEEKTSNTDWLAYFAREMKLPAGQKPDKLSMKLLGWENSTHLRVQVDAAKSGRSSLLDWQGLMEVTGDDVPELNRDPLHQPTAASGKPTEVPVAPLTPSRNAGAGSGKNPPRPTPVPKRTPPGPGRADRIEDTRKLDNL